MLGWGVGSCMCTCVCELVSECMCVLGEVGSYADFILSGDSRSESRERLHITQHCTLNDIWSPAPELWINESDLLCAHSGKKNVD